MGRLRIDILITGLIGAIIGGLIVSFALNSLQGNPAPNEAAVASASPGTELLSSLHCHQGEILRTVMKGVEDNYAFGNLEIAREHPRLKKYPGASVEDARSRDYDERGHDKILADFFDIPANISRGILVIKIKPAHPDTNDFIYIGDLYDRDPAQSLRMPHAFAGKIKFLAELPGWHKQGELYSVRFSDLEFDIERQVVKRTHKTLLEYLKDGDGSKIVDIKFSDDTVVDFSGIAFCEKPTGHYGLTLSELVSMSDKPDQISFLSCAIEVTQKNCNPYYGDTICETELPVACFQDLGLDKPDYIPDQFGGGAWSGGKMAYSRPVRGDSFDTVNDVNEFCQSEFGPNWRMANFHDGNNFNIVSLRQGALPKDRAWVDIKDQREATCWAR